MLVDDKSRVEERKLNRWAWFVSMVVFLLVVVMRRFKIETNIDFTYLPAIYSTINAITFVLLLIGFYLIRFRRDQISHQRVMSAAMVASGLFLLLYVLYHMTTPETSFCGEGPSRAIYFMVLISHIVLAAVILPFILFTYIRAYTKQFQRHKKLARWVWPLWLYVAASGPIIYLMLRPCY